MFAKTEKMNDGIGKENLDKYFTDLAKEIKKEFGRDSRFEIIIVGGASIILNYNFRQSTKDIDAYFSAKSGLKDAINRVGDKNGLPNGWLNSDFIKTPSFSTKILEHSKYYRTFNHVLAVRSIEDEYLIAMKLVSFRQYKYDQSDIAGIINHSKGENVTFEKVDKAVVELYGGWNGITDNAKEFLQECLKTKDANFYKKVRQSELENKEILLKMNEKDLQNLSDTNIPNLLNAAKETKEKMISTENQLTLDELIEKINEVSGDGKELN